MGSPWKAHAISAAIVWGASGASLHFHLVMDSICRFWFTNVVYKSLWAYLKEKCPHLHKRICASRIAPAPGSSLWGSTLDQPETSPGGVVQLMQLWLHIRNKTCHYVLVRWGWHWLWPPAEDWAGRRLLGWKQGTGCSEELMHMPAGNVGRCPVHLGTAELGNACNGDGEQIWGWVWLPPWPCSSQSPGCGYKGGMPCPHCF